MEQAQQPGQHEPPSEGSRESATRTASRKPQRLTAPPTGIAQRGQAGAKRGVAFVVTVKWQVAYVVAAIALMAYSVTQRDTIIDYADPAMSPSLMSITVTVCFLVGLLLIGDYRAGGNPRMLIIGCAFAWSASVQFIRMFILWFDIDFFPHGDVATAFGVLVFREVGFTAICAGAAVRWHSGIYEYVAARQNRDKVVAFATLGIGATSTIPTVWVSLRHDHDIALVVNEIDYSALAAYAAPVAIPIIFLLMGAAIWGYVVKGRGGSVGAWVGTAAVTSSLNAIMLFEAGTAGTFGWYAVRFTTMNICIIVAIATVLRVRRDQRLADLYRSEADLIERVSSKTQANAAEISRELGQMRDALRHETVVRREVIATVADKIELPVAELQMTLGASLDRLRWVQDQQSRGEPRAGVAMSALEREIARALEAIDSFGATVVAIRSQAENVASTEELISEQQQLSSAKLNVLLDLCKSFAPDRQVVSFCDDSIEIRVEALPFQQVIGGLLRSLPSAATVVEISAAFDRRDIEIEIRPELNGTELDAYWEPCTVSSALAAKFGWTLECIEHEATYLLRIPALASEYPARIG